jgi:hypothetical protein
VITEALLNVLVGVVQGFGSLLPTYTVDVSGLTAGATSVGGLAASMNGYAPVLVLGVALAVVFGYWLALLAFRGVVWLYHQVWGSD